MTGGAERDGRAAETPPASSAPSALDDWATVWAAWIARAPRAWGVLLGGVALYAALERVRHWPAVVAAVVALLAPRFRRLDALRGRLALVVGIAAVALPLAGWNGSDEHVPSLLPLGLAVAAGVSTLCVVRTRVPWHPALALGALGVAVVAAVTRWHTDVASVLGYAVLGPVIAAASRSGKRIVWAAVVVGTISMVFAAAPEAGREWQLGATWWPEVWVTRGALALAVAVAARAARFGTPSPAVADAASARLVVRVHRRPWTAAFVGCLLFVLFEPLMIVAVGSLDRPSVAIPPAAFASLAVVSTWSAASGGFWAASRIAIAGTLALGLWVLPLIGWRGSWIPLVLWQLTGPVAALVLPWFSVRRAPSARAGPAGAACAALACVTSVVWVLGESNDIDRFFALAAANGVLWVFVLVRAATSATTGPFVLTMWLFAHALAVVASLIPGHQPWVFPPPGSRLDPVWIAGVLLGTSLLAVHGIVVVAAARRLVSLCVVPDTHPLIADWAVDRRAPSAEPGAVACSASAGGAP